MEAVDGYWDNKNFVPYDVQLPIIEIGDMVTYRYGLKDKKYKVIAMHHYYEWVEEKNIIMHWASVKTEGSRKFVQADFIGQIFKAE